MRIDLNLLGVFEAVAESQNFRAAADRLGVSRSAVSQAIQKLENAIGRALVLRNTRSVRLTEAGEGLHARIRQPMLDMRSAMERLGADDRPRGLLRLAVTSIAEEFLSGPLLSGFATANPGIIIDVTVTDDEFDIVAAGFDAGVRLGDVIEQDMIAIPVTGEQREAAVASPAYLAEHGTPSHPRDLTGHRCIGWRRAPQLAPYRWEFEENGTAFDVAVEPQITTNDLRLMLRSALCGGGITFAPRPTFQPYVDRGELVWLLEAFLPAFPGFYLYYPQRRNMAPKLRALITHIQHWDAGADHFAGPV